MGIWQKSSTVEELNRWCEGTIHDSLGIRFTELTDDSISATMPVDARTKQPVGLLHGGASVVLAESLGSVASHLASPEGSGPVGIEVNANHLKAVRNGTVTGTVRAVHLGGRLHVWGIEITDSAEQLICSARLTVFVQPPKAPTS